MYPSSLVLCAEGTLLVHAPEMKNSHATPELIGSDLHLLRAGHTRKLFRLSLCVCTCACVSGDDQAEAGAVGGFVTADWQLKQVTVSVCVYTGETVDYLYTYMYFYTHCNTHTHTLLHTHTHSIVRYKHTAWGNPHTHHSKYNPTHVCTGV